MLYVLVFLAILIFVSAYVKNKICKNQENFIQKSTYLDEVEVNGIKKVIRKPKCPVCGNADLNYQIVSNSARKYGDGERTYISKSKHAICNKCGHDFVPILNASPGCSVWFVAIIIGVLVTSILMMVISVIGLMFL